jgi:hypothetical protein
MVRFFKTLWDTIDALLNGVSAVWIVVLVVAILSGGLIGWCGGGDALHLKSEWDFLESESPRRAGGPLRSEDASTARADR